MTYVQLLNLIMNEATFPNLNEMFPNLTIRIRDHLVISFIEPFLTKHPISMGNDAFEISIFFNKFKSKVFIFSPDIFIQSLFYEYLLMTTNNLKRCIDRKALIRGKDPYKTCQDFHYILCCKRGLKNAFLKKSFQLIY